MRRRRRRPVRRQLVGIILLLNEINVHPSPPPSASTHSLHQCAAAAAAPQLDEASNCGVAFPVALSSRRDSECENGTTYSPPDTLTHTHAHMQDKTDADTRTHIFDLQTEKLAACATESPNRAPLLPPLSRQTRRCSPN